MADAVGGHGSHGAASRRTRVVMLLDNHYGPDRRIEMEAELLRRHGAQVRVIAWDRRDRPAGGEAPQGAELIRVNVPAPSGGGKRTFVAMFAFARRVLRAHRRLAADADVLVVHDIYLLPLGWLMSLLLRCPLVYDAHEDYAAMEGLRYPGWWLRAMTTVENLLARRAAVIVVPGESRRARWERAGFPSPVVLRNLGLGRPRPRSDEPPSWDIAYCGTIADVRRLDVLLDAARARPELRVLIAGRGRGADVVRDAAAELPNVEYRGWTADADSLALSARALYYGLDPEHPYAAKACPNTLYDALRLRRPLLYFCGGEVADVAERFAIGARCEPDAASLLRAFDAVTASDAVLQADAAWDELTGARSTETYVRAVLEAARRARTRDDA